MSESLSSALASRQKRMTGTEHADQDNAVRSGIWFEDGSIILQASNTQFRVHKGLLSRNSSFFRDMFTVPQPENEPMVEGCAIVHVADDPEDWRYVLEILYDNVKAYKSIHTVSFPMLASMLRLGGKYEFEHLREAAMERLKGDLPVTLDSWDNQFNADSIRKRPLSYHIFDLINLLSELGILSLLPVAYYTCLVQYNLDHILRGQKAPNGTLHDLPLEAKISLALGREALLKAITHPSEWFMGCGLEGCSKPVSCTSARIHCLSVVIEHWEKVLVFFPLTWVALHDHRTTFCATCAQNVAKEIEVSRKKIWEELPGYFRLPKWDDLKDN
ncbi:hypothetical protein GALMADRAFT_105104 [Galerina marginata CBS 339.88]|uniref:BTB domain-containing protein n=1 Tax=Galerina marginata (strain CBS 339.88) TaxID=685588 RepID=A0A067SDV5_GALM3|nr:hypothetical protein GALMADRAFT_105104 [Galerina marginata CBS 339.88]